MRVPMKKSLLIFLGIIVLSFSSKAGGGTHCSLEEFKIFEQRFLELTRRESGSEFRSEFGREVFLGGIDRVGATTASERVDDEVEPSDAPWWRSAVDYVGEDEVSRIIKSVSKISDATWHSVVSYSRDLIREGMSGGDIVSIIKAVLDITSENLDPDARRESVLSAGAGSIASGTSREISSLVGDDFLGTPESPFFEPTARAVAYEEMNDKTRSSVVAHARELIRDGMNGKELSSIIDFVKGISSAARPPVVARVRELSGGNILSIIDAVKGISDAARRGVVAHARELSEGDIVSIIDAVKGISDTLWARVVAHARELIREEMRGDDIASIIRAVSEISNESWPSIALHTNELRRPGMGGADIASIIGALNGIKDTTRARVVSHARELIREEMRGCDRASIIRAVNEINYAAQPRAPHMETGDTASIMHPMTEIRVTWPSIVLHTNELRRPSMGGDDIASIMHAVSKISNEAWPSIALHTNELRRPGMGGADVASIIGALNGIKDTRRPSVVSHVRDIIDEREGMSGDDIASIMCAMSGISSETRKSGGCSIS
jgi:hypothetical protein